MLGLMSHIDNLRNAFLVSSEPLTAEIAEDLFTVEWSVCDQESNAAYNEKRAHTHFHDCLQDLKGKLKLILCMF